VKGLHALKPLFDDGSEPCDFLTDPKQFPKPSLFGKLKALDAAAENQSFGVLCPAGFLETAVRSMSANLTTTGTLN
jgi:hypothetical protein